MESKVFDPSLMENRFRHEFKYLSTLGQPDLAGTEAKGSGEDTEVVLPDHKRAV